MDKKELEEILDKKLEGQREQYERYMGILAEKIISENKASYELVEARMDKGFAENKEAHEEMNAKIDALTEMVVDNTERINALEGHVA